MQKILGTVGLGLLMASLAGNALAAPKASAKDLERHKRVIHEYEVKHIHNVAALKRKHDERVAEQKRHTRVLDNLKAAHDRKVANEKRHTRVLDAYARKHEANVAALKRAHDARVAAQHKKK